MIDLTIANYLKLKTETICVCGRPIDGEICPVCGWQTNVPNFFNPGMMNMAERALSNDGLLFSRYVLTLVLFRRELPSLALVRATPEQRRRAFYEVIKP